jgi:mono/diheme cytochrome c family protein
MRRAVGTTLLASAVVAVALLLAACGSEGTVSPVPETVEGTIAQPTETAPPTSTVEGDPAAGKAVFASAGCGSCHTLADAGSSGTIGPNLDDAKPSLELALDRVTNGAGPMPSFKGQLTDKQIADVAAYVVQATSG